MTFDHLLAAGLLAVAVSNPGGDAARAHALVQNNAVSVSASVAAAATPSVPTAGSSAPDFTYQSSEHLWQNLHNVLEQGAVLLVFGASDANLRAIERERETLLERGILPMVVVERRDTDVWGVVRRLELTYSLLADPHGAIGEQYGVLDPASKRSHASWFAIDRAGRVCAHGEGELPISGWTSLAVQALGLPADGAIRSASSH